ncbi:hypothetical protein ACFL43_00140 [Thermodesulfobacteriota bacterium]
MSIAYDSNQSNRHVIIILLCSLSAHGLLLLNDGVYWDGWIIYNYLTEKNWYHVYLFCAEPGGIPVGAFFHWMMGYFPDIIFGYKLVSFISITLSGVLVYRICNHFDFGSRRDSLCIAIMSILYPAFQCTIELIITFRILCLCLFLLAGLLFIKSEKAKSFTRYLLRASALALFIISFTHRSFLVFYYAFFLVYILYMLREEGGLERKTVYKTVIHNLPYLAIPVAYLALSSLLFPAFGFQSKQYSTDFTLQRMFESCKYFFQVTAINQLEASLKNMLSLPLASLLVLLAAAVPWIYPAARLNMTDRSRNRINPLKLLALGLALFFLGIFAYAAARKTPSMFGWTSRHSLLVGLPMAVVLLSLVRLVVSAAAAALVWVKRNRNYARMQVQSRLELSVLTILMGAFCLSTVTSYISWQARWVHDRSIMTQLPSLKAAEKTSIFWVNDFFQAFGESYRDYEWSSIFKEIWGDESRIGVDYRVRSAHYFVDQQAYLIDRYIHKDFDPKGCQANLTIRPGPEMQLGKNQSLDLTVRYFYFKFLFAEHLENFLSGVTDIQLQPIQASQAVNCSG